MRPPGRGGAASPTWRKGKPGKGTITADECVYTPTLQKAVFQGHVHVVDRGRLRAETESLIYRGDKNLVAHRRPGGVQAQGPLRHAPRA